MDKFDSLRILIIDDNRHMRALLRTLLRAVGIRQVCEAADGVAAMVELKGFMADVILCDWNMQPMDGLSFAKLLRSNPNSPNPFVPIIMLTAHAESHRVIAARDAGVDEFLTKPVTPKALYSRLLEVIEHPRSFIRTGTYCGPDRRRKERAFRGPNRRKWQQGRLSADQVRDLLGEGGE